jgi:hypothetical protein
MIGAMESRKLVYILNRVRLTFFPFPRLGSCFNPSPPCRMLPPTSPSPPLSKQTSPAPSSTPSLVSMSVSKTPSSRHSRSITPNRIRTLQERRLRRRRRCLPTTSSILVSTTWCGNGVSRRILGRIFLSKVRFSLSLPPSPPSRAHFASSTVPGGQNAATDRFDGPSGVLVCCEDYIIYKHQGAKEHRVPIPKRANPLSDPERGVIITSAVMHKMRVRLVVFLPSLLRCSSYSSTGCVLLPAAKRGG